MSESQPQGGRQDDLDAILRAASDRIAQAAAAPITPASPATLSTPAQVRHATAPGVPSRQQPIHQAAPAAKRRTPYPALALALVVFVIAAAELVPVLGMFLIPLVLIGAGFGLRSMRLRQDDERFALDRLSIGLDIAALVIGVVIVALDLIVGDVGTMLWALLSPGS